MKKSLLMKTMLLLWALIVGSSSVWADTVTFNYADYNKQGTSSTGSVYTMEKTDVSITNTKFYGNNSYAHFYANGVTTITPADGVTITEIKLTASATNYNGYQSSGEITTSTGSVSGSTSSTTVTWTGSATNAFTISNNKQIRWTSIVVTYEGGGGSGSSAVATTTTINASGITNTDVYKNTTAGTLSATVKAGENDVDNATVTWSGDNDDVATIDASSGTVTLVAAGTVTFTATYAGVEDEYESSSDTYEMTVTDSTPQTGGWVLTDLANLAAGDVFVIVGNNGKTYALSNDNGAGSAPKAVEVTIANNEITSDVSNDIKWNISGNATDGYTFYPKGDIEKWLYCTNTNNGVRVGTNDAKTFTIKDDYLYHKGTSRYVGIYNSSDWRCYTSINSNIKDQSIAFYKYEESSSKADPQLSFSPTELNVTIGKDFTIPTLNAAESFDGTVEYSSSDESVAMIENSETGELRLLKEGTTTITATFAGNDDFKAGSASYTLTVTDNRIATTITQENIVLEVSEVASLTQLNPVVKDANDNVIPYEFSEFLSIVSFEQVSEDDVISDIDNNTGQITLSGNVGTATLKAYYNRFNGDTTYKPSECTFTITVESVLKNIAALTANTVEGTYKVNLTNAVVTYTNGNYAYIQDASGAVAYYKNGHDLTAGDIFNGKATVAYKLNNKTPQITSIEDVTPTAGEAPAPTIVAAADWNYTFNEVLSQYFTITGATLTQGGTKYYVQLNGESVQLYKVGSSISSLDLKKTYTITGFPTFYNTTKELQIFVDPEVEPSVAVSPDKVNADAAGVNGTVAITYEKLEISDAEDFNIQFYNGEGEETETPDWIVAEVTDNNGDYVVSYSIAENTSTEARTAYMKVYALDDNAENVYSELITITQAGVADKYALFTGDLVEGDYIIYYNGRAMNTKVDDSSRLQYAEVTPENDVISTNNAAIVWHIAKSGDYWTIYNAEADEYAASTGVKNKAQMLADGTNDMALWTVSGTEEYEFVNKANAAANVNAYLRNNGSYGFACYASSTGGDLLLYKRVPATITLAEACNNGKGKYYGTYSNASAFVVPSDLTVAEIGLDAENKLIVTEYATGDIVPANTGVMVSSTEYGDYSVELTHNAGTSVMGNDNCLRATGNEGITAATMDVNDVDCVFYRLTMHNKTDLGFYWGAEEGAAFAVAANKAYLAVPKSAGARIQGFSFDGDTVTGISQIENGKSEVENYFDLQGRRIANPAKGLYIKNGKKVVIR